MRMMMSNELSDYYFLTALKAANNAELTKAIRHAAVSMGINRENDECRKLAGLCYYKLGNYIMAEYCFNNSSYYLDKIKDLLSEKKKLLDDIGQLVNNRQYKKAIRVLEEEKDKSVNEYNYLGCLYAAVCKHKKAAACFMEALKEDSTNEEALYYLKNIQIIKEKRWWNI